ncbi:MAG: T9SS type A sorting domain-containing protein [Bacteroidales bacterium]|jgi:predicted outer membrane repeat protein|nr:T9SS type A sorting domain-containing protein [Bacteroidales bacterium]
MKKIIFFITFLFFQTFINLHAQDTLFIKEHKIIDMGESMIIEPNTVVLFTGEYKITVVGTIIAKGTEENPIKFTSMFNQNNPQGTSWRGIAFLSVNDNPTADSSIFEHCTFEHSYTYLACGNEGNGGAVNIYNSSIIRFSDCIFQNNCANFVGGAVALTNSDVVLERCIFQNNNTSDISESYGGAIATENSAFKMYNCIFDGNTSSSVGGAIYCNECNDAAIVGCEFRNNTGSSGGAAFITGCRDLKFNNNLFHHNTSTFFGAAFAVKNSNFRMLNCTVADNHSKQSGGGIYCSNDVIINIYNSIFAKNEAESSGDQIHIAYNESIVNLSNCTIEGGKDLFSGAGSGEYFLGIYNEIIEENIEFETYDNYDYYLPGNSPCIDAGEMKVLEYLDEYDFAGNARVVNGLIDIGAFERVDVLNIDKYNDEINELLVYPNPANDFITINLSSETLYGNYYIIDISGKILKTFNIKQINSKVNISDLNTGIYFIKNDFGYVSKFIVE